MMSWQAWQAPADWPDEAPPVRWQVLPLAEGHAARLWLFHLDAPDSDHPALTACLSNDERARAARFRQELHARRHRVSRSMVRLLLGKLCGCPAADLVWLEGPHGKPSVASPAGDRGRLPAQHFNLSHSGAWAILATSNAMELGVDIEARDNQVHVTSLAPRILSPEEHGHLHLDPTAPDHSDTLLRFWTRKEACLKALGVGLTQDMNTLTLSGTDGNITASSCGFAVPAPPMGLAWADVALPEDCLAVAACAWLPQAHPHQTHGSADLAQSGGENPR